jgi:hypothetical protein
LVQPQSRGSCIAAFSYQECGPKGQQPRCLGLLAESLMPHKHCFRQGRTFRHRVHFRAL